MKRKTVYKPIFGFASFVLATLVMVNIAKADGTDPLGPPSIPIAVGSDVLVEGVGLNDSQPGDITIETPVGVSIAQVLLYWTGFEGQDDTIEVEGFEVTGIEIAGSAIDDLAYTYRADVTASNWVAEGAVTSLSVGGLDFSPHNNGAFLVVILDDGSTVDLQIRDGSDLAYLPLPWDEQTTPVIIPIAPSDDARTATVNLVVTDIKVPRPAALEVIVGGVTNLLTDIFLDNEGDFLDVVELTVDVPAGATNVSMQALSIDDGSGLEPASLYWHFVSWVLPEPPVDEGCTYTIGYWKNHDWPSGTNDLSIFTAEKAMELLWAPSGGNAYIILAKQYIGAELNVVNGASLPGDVEAAWLVAQGILLDYASEEDIDKKDYPEDRAWAIDLAGLLDDYNNGYIGPGHCD